MSRSKPFDLAFALLCCAEIASARRTGRRTQANAVQRPTMSGTLKETDVMQTGAMPMTNTATDAVLGSRDLGKISKTKTKTNPLSHPAKPVHSEEFHHMGEFGDHSMFRKQSILPCYYLWLAFFVALLVLTFIHESWMSRQDDRMKDMKCEFLDFKRPSPSSEGEAAASPPPGGFFNPVYCPKAPKGGLQEEFEPYRWTVYRSLMYTIPYKSIRFAVQMALITGILKLLLAMARFSKLLEWEFVTFHGEGYWFKGDSFWVIAFKNMGNVAVACQVVLAFFLMAMTRIRMKWFLGLKTQVRQVKQDVELVAFKIGALMPGDDALRVEARYDMHRWLTAAHFWNYQPIVQLLSRFDVQSLCEQGLLSQAEARIIKELTSPKRSRTPDTIISDTQWMNPAIYAALVTDDEGVATIKNLQPDEQWQVNVAGHVRDVLLWWLQLRLQAAVKEKLVDKDKLKKILAAVWTARKSMQMVVDVSRLKPMYITNMVMRIFVEVYLACTVFAIVGRSTKHIWALAWPMLEAFVIALFNDLLLTINSSMHDPFDCEVNGPSISIDPVLVLTERTCFFNMAFSEKNDLPSKLASTWEAAKLVKEEKKDKGKKDKDDDD